MSDLFLPPISSMCVRIYFSNKCNPEKLYNKLPITKDIMALRLKFSRLDIDINLDTKFRTIRLFRNCMNILSCKNLDEANAIIRKFSQVSGINFNITEIKELMVTHKYQIPFHIDIDKILDTDFIKLSPKIIELEHTSFFVNGRNIIQVSSNSERAHESFVNFTNKINGIMFEG